MFPIYPHKEPTIVRAKINEQDTIKTLVVYFTNRPNEPVQLFQYFDTDPICSPCTYLGLSRRSAIQLTMGIAQKIAS